MKVDAIFDLNIRGKVITGSTPWKNNVQFQNEQILTCGNKQWRVVSINKIYQGCFGFTPELRHHSLQLLPIGHNKQPNIGDELV